jgi:uncharacterized protein (TIGR02145 family)
MKRLFIIWIGLVISLTILNAQAPPQAFSYKAIIKKANGDIVTNKTISLRISILQNSSIGLSVYTEKFSPTTNIQGQIDIEIGRGTVVTGNFSSIEWSASEYFLKTEVDIKGGSNYTVLSVTQLLSIPYALYSSEAGHALSANYYNLYNRPTSLSQFNNDKGFLINESDPVFSSHPAKNITYENISNWNSVYGWGNHSVAGYAFSSNIYTKSDLQTAGNSQINWENLSGKPVFAAVATTGNYNDLSNSPEIPTSLNQITPDAGNRIITNVASPVNAQDAATKEYVDILKERIKKLEKLLGVTEPPMIVKDIDGNVYDTVKIGTQIWMKQDLKVTHYRNGDSIPYVTGSEWSNLNTGAYSWYNNDTTYRSYGAKYNWFAVTDSRNICPAGWHVPTDGEWTILTTYLGASNGAGNKLKEEGTEHWQSPNTGANNESGFTALPVGVLNFDCTFTGLGTYGLWWSTTEISNDNAWSRAMYFHNANVVIATPYKKAGISVRCLEGDALPIVLPSITTQPASNITSTGASIGVTVTNETGAEVISRGICWNASQNPTILNNKISGGAEGTDFTCTLTGLNPNLTYYVRAYVTTSLGTAYGEQLTFKTSAACYGCETGNETDSDGNAFKTIKIGDQWWMAENLKTTKFSDGTPVQLVTDNTAWGNSITPAYSWYGNDVSTNKDTYGALYNGYTVSDSRNICPTGWHMPTDNDWNVLTSYVSGSSVGPGGKLKESGTVHWQNPNTGTTNETGFTALPGGLRDPIGNFAMIKSYGVWWSSSESDIESLIYRRMLSSSTTVEMNRYSKKYGVSIRCIKGDASPLLLPIITTSPVSSISSTGAGSGGNITSDAGLPILQRGVCWNTMPNPFIGNSKASEMPGTGAFTINLNSLLPNTTYYIRAYATNSSGTGYGNEIMFKTNPGVPPINTQPTSAITATTAKSGGSISQDGGSPVTERGVCWNTTVNPTIANSKTVDGSGTGNFVSNLTNLTPGIKYYVRAYATNSFGTAYGTELNFTAGLPVVSSIQISSYTSTSAVGGGIVSGDGGSPVTARGICWGTSVNPTIANSKTTDGTGTGSFVSTITGLTPNTLYYVRAYATNSYGTFYANGPTFTTSIATLSTDAITSIMSNSAVSGGNIINDGGDAITSRGVCWGTTPGPTTGNNKTLDGSGTGSFISNLTGLPVATLIYVRAYATCSSGTSYGNEISFLTSAGLSVIITTPINSITATTAKSGGTIISNGGTNIIKRGVCWNTAPNPTTANSKTSSWPLVVTDTSSMTGLLPNTTYYVRAYSENIAGVAYGNELSFTTNTTTTVLPTLTTKGITSITQTTAASGGLILSNGGAPVTIHGVCWSQAQNPSIVDGKTMQVADSLDFISSIWGLTPGITYYLRAYATNSAGTAYGNELSFTTSSELVIGDSIEGGIVAYIFQPGDPGYINGELHGIIAAPIDQSSGIQWYNGADKFIGAIYSGLGLGRHNTDTLVLSLGIGNYAARVCYDLVRGYSDWYLPSKDELNKLFLSKEKVHLSPVYYWTSTENSASTAWAQDFTGSQMALNKSTLNYVRAVRSF